MSATLAMLYRVLKLRIGFAIMLCAVAGIAVTPGVALTPGQVLMLALAVLTASAAAGAFNQYAERDLDACMQRTQARPFVTGRLRAVWYWPLGLALLLLASVLLAAYATNALAAAYVFLGAFTYGVVYTVWLKRRTRLNIVVGGLAGSFAVLAGAAAVSPSLSPEAVILAGVLFLWTPPHFWSLAFAYRDEYRRAGVPMLPVVVSSAAAAWIIFAHALTLAVLSVTPFAFSMGWIYLMGAVIGGGWFVYKSWQLVRHPTEHAAMSNFRASLAQLGLLLLGAMLDGGLGTFTN